MPTEILWIPNCAPHFLDTATRPTFLRTFQKKSGAGVSDSQAPNSLWWLWIIHEATRNLLRLAYRASTSDHTSTNRDRNRRAFRQRKAPRGHPTCRLNSIWGFRSSPWSAAPWIVSASCVGKDVTWASAGLEHILQTKWLSFMCSYRSKKSLRRLHISLTTWESLLCGHCLKNSTLLESRSQIQHKWWRCFECLYRSSLSKARNLQSWHSGWGVIVLSAGSPSSRWRISSSCIYNLCSHVKSYGNKGISTSLQKHHQTQVSLDLGTHDRGNQPYQPASSWTLMYLTSARDATKFRSATLLAKQS